MRHIRQNRTQGTHLRWGGKRATGRLVGAYYDGAARVLGADEANIVHSPTVYGLFLQRLQRLPQRRLLLRSFVLLEWRLGLGPMFLVGTHAVLQLVTAKVNATSPYEFGFHQIPTPEPSHWRSFAAMVQP